MMTSVKSGMKIIKLIENKENGLSTDQITCSNRVYEKLLECQYILGHLSYDVDLWDEFQGRGKTNWDAIRDFLDQVFNHLPVQHTNVIMDFILSNK